MIHYQSKEYWTIDLRWLIILKEWFAMTLNLPDDNTQTRPEGLAVQFLALKSSLNLTLKLPCMKGIFEHG